MTNKTRLNYENVQYSPSVSRVFQLNWICSVSHKISVAPVGVAANAIIQNEHGKSMKLSILTPAIWRRIDKARDLARMVNHYADVEHVVILDNMTRSVGLKRQACMDAAIGDYVIFCDDDDEIYPETIPLILEAIKRNPDVITFKQRAIYNGLESTVVFDLNAQDGPFNPGGITHRAPWHVCVWKRELVADCIFPDSSYGEDRVWSEQARLRAKTSCHIDKVLHCYRHDARETAAPEPNELSAPAVGVPRPCSGVPTREQLEKYIKFADLELGPDCCDPWVDWCRLTLRSAREKASLPNDTAQTTPSRP